MPYKDEKLKKEYQKRTATPYMKEWREKNREKHRIYIREWKRKQYAIPEKRTRILELNKVGESYEIAKKRTMETWRDKIKSLHDLYIVGLLTRRSGLSRRVIYDNYEIIELYRKIILTKRLLKQINNGNDRNKLTRHETSLKRKFARIADWKKETLNCKRSE